MNRLMHAEFIHWMWFGKVPGLGDFVHRHMPDMLKEQFDRWAQLRLQGFSIDHPENWTEYYLSAPVWRFILGAAVTDISEPRLLTGICMPSVDRVGRYFPLIIVGQCVTTADDSDVDFFENDLRLTAVSEIALKALDEDWDADELDLALRDHTRSKSSREGFDSLIQSLSLSEGFSSTRALTDLDLATSLAVRSRQSLRIAPAKTLWYRGFESQNYRSILSALVCEGLPDQSAFNALMGC